MNANDHTSFGQPMCQDSNNCGSNYRMGTGGQDYNIVCEGEIGTDCSGKDDT